MKPRIAVTLLLLTGLQACTSPAPQTEPFASDWTKAGDGSYSHKPSGALCAASVGGFTLKGLQLLAVEGRLGTCEYADSSGRRGEIRVRRYLPGVGETPLAIENDKTLMEGGTVPGQPDQKPTSTIRIGPGPAIDGEPSQREVITVKRNGLLIDCAAWEKVSQFTNNSPIVEFAISCLHMPGE
jgi:hypothetical protein